MEEGEWVDFLCSGFFEGDCAVGGGGTGCDDIVDEEDSGALKAWRGDGSEGALGIAGSGGAGKVGLCLGCDDAFAECGVGGNAGASGKGFGEELGLVVASLAEALWVERNGDDEVDGAFFEQELEFGPHKFAEFVGEFWGIAVFEEVDECAGGGGHA